MAGRGRRPEGLACLTFAASCSICSVLPRSTLDTFCHKSLRVDKSHLQATKSALAPRGYRKFLCSPKLSTNTRAATMNPPSTPPAQFTRDPSLSSPPAAPRAGQVSQQQRSVSTENSPTLAVRNSGPPFGLQQAALQQVQPSSAQQPTLAQQFIHRAEQNAASTQAGHAHQATVTQRTVTTQGQTGTQQDPNMQQANIAQQQQGASSAHYGGASSGATG